MKKTLSLWVAICFFLLSEAVFAAPEWRAKSLLYQYDFQEEQGYFADSGDWGIRAPEAQEAEAMTVEDSRFIAVSGEWSETGEGIFQDSEEAAVLKAVWKEQYKNPVLSAEITPQSEEPCVFVYFSMLSGSDYAAVELNQNGSKLTAGGAEYPGGGALKKDEKTTLCVEIFEDTAAVYQDGELILYQSGLPLSDGWVGFGSWATKMQLQNAQVAEQNPVGNGKKLVQESAEEAFAVFPEMTGENFLFQARLGADNFSKGAIGISVRTQENRDGYRIRLDGERIFAYRRENGQDTLLKKSACPALSDRLYTLTVTADRDKFLVEVNHQTALEFSDDTFSSGAIGCFSKGTRLYVESVSQWRLAEVTVPVYSEGNTTYYLDGISGDDRKDGTTPETAWKTLDKLAFCRFSAGDQILFRRGCTYEGTLTLSGAEHMTVSAWGEGENPVISGCRYAAEISDSSAVTLNSLTLKIRHAGTKENPKSGIGAAVSLKNTDMAQLSDCTLIGSGAEKNTLPVLDAESSVWCRNTICQDFGDNTLPGADVPEEVQTHWAYPVMSRLVRDGILQEYRPDDPITRAEFAVLLTKYIPLREDEYHWIFPDVGADFWGASALQTLYNYRMISEEMLQDGMVLPDQPVTRAEAAAMLSGMAEEKTEENPEFSDLSDAPDWTREKILKACRTGLFAGREDHIFAPNETLTRAETAVLLSKL